MLAARPAGLQSGLLMAGSVCSAMRQAQRAVGGGCSVNLQTQCLAPDGAAALHFFPLHQLIPVSARLKYSLSTSPTGEAPSWHLLQQTSSWHAAELEEVDEVSCQLPCVSAADVALEGSCCRSRCLAAADSAIPALLPT